MKTFTYETDNHVFTILIGQNAQDNWDLIDKSEPEDIWIHLADYASCHVIIKSENQKITNNVIRYAGRLCLENTKVKNLKYFHMNIIYTTIKNVKKDKTVGSVLTKNEKTLRI